MIGLVVAGYGDFPEVMLNIMQQIGGEQTHICAVPIIPSNKPENIEANRQALFRAITSVDTGEGVLVLTDDMGEDAGLITQSLMQETIIETLSGANVPMLREVSLRRGATSLRELATYAREAARKGIVLTTAGPAE